MKHINGTRLIGIDHGYGNIKTANCCFPTGVVDSDTEAELLYLIDDIREQLILPGKQGRREVASWQQQASGPSRDS